MAVKESYDEIKNKTIQWCQKLLDNKIYDQEKYNKCVGSFIDLGVGQLPNDMVTPSKGNEFEYGLYGHAAGSTNQGVIPSDTNNKIMLSTTNNLFLMSDENGFVSTTSTDTIVDQEVFQWSLVKRTNTQYSLMSKFKKFLGCDDNGRVTANRDEISNTSIWNISSVNSYITIESIQYPGQFITADTKVHLAINSGESQKWMITVVPKADEGFIIPFNAVSLKAKKESKINEIVTLYKKKYQLLAEYKLVDSLITETDSSYVTIMKTVDKNINNINTIYNDFIKKIKAKYNKPSDTIASLSTAERAELANYTDINNIRELEPDIINRPTSCADADISNSLCNYFQVSEIRQAEVERINELDRLKKSLNTEINTTTNKINELDKEISDIMIDIQIKTDENARIIKGNNMELTRQAGLIDQIQRDNLGLDAKKAMLEKSAEQAKLNQEISSYYYSSNLYNNYALYAIILLVIGLICLMIVQFVKKIV